MRQSKCSVHMWFIIISLLYLTVFVSTIPLPNNQHINADPSDWDHLLRELIFKTISPPPRNSDLYKEILNAPFYKAPIQSVSINESVSLLAQGQLFYIPNHRWILCQEGCENCDECPFEEDPILRWILRRIRRPGPRFDLQLTLNPQSDQLSYNKNMGLQSYVYVISDPRHVEMDEFQWRSRRKESNFHTAAKQHKERSKDDLEIVDMPQFGPILDAISNVTDPFDSRIVLGTDHKGKKYLVQIVQADETEEAEEKKSKYVPSSTPSISAAISRASYQNVLRRVMNSLNTHRKFIENFLSQDQMMSNVSSHDDDGDVKYSKRMYKVPVKGTEKSDGQQDSSMKSTIRNNFGILEDTAEVVPLKDTQRRIPRLNNRTEEIVKRLNKARGKSTGNITFGYISK